MNLSFNKSLGKWKMWAAAACILPWLAACSSVAPGMPADVSRLNGADGSDAPVEVTPITPQLVKADKELRQRQSTNDVSKLIAKPKPYLIESGDVLSITVWDHPELAGNAGQPQQAGVSDPAPGFVVDHQGMIQFPYAGALKMAGLTQEDARALLTTKLARYIAKPNVTLRVQSYRSKRVYIDGEVKNPGLQAINDIPMSLVEAINRAGGVLPTADQNRMVLTRDGVNYPLNFLDLVQKGVDPGRIMLANGDVLRVMSRDESKIFVSGEVTTPKALTMHNGRLTLNEALGEAGGVNVLTGDGGQVYVVRRDQQTPKVYRLDARSPGALALAEGFELNPRDVVYVAASPLANWHRSISLLFPGALTSAVGLGK